MRFEWAILAGEGLFTSMSPHVNCQSVTSTKISFANFALKSFFQRMLCNVHLKIFSLLKGIRLFTYGTKVFCTAIIYRHKQCFLFVCRTSRCVCTFHKRSCIKALMPSQWCLLAPSGALIAIPTYYWPTTTTPPTFSDHTSPQHCSFTFWATTAI